MQEVCRGITRREKERVERLLPHCQPGLIAFDALDGCLVKEQEQEEGTQCHSIDRSVPLWASPAPTSAWQETLHLRACSVHVPTTFKCKDTSGWALQRSINTTRSKAGKETIITNPDLVRTIQLRKWFSKIPSVGKLIRHFMLLGPLLAKFLLLQPCPSRLSFTFIKLMVNGVGVIFRRRASKDWVRLKSTVWST